MSRGGGSSGQSKQGAGGLRPQPERGWGRLEGQQEAGGVSTSATASWCTPPRFFGTRLHGAVWASMLGLVGVQLPPEVWGSAWAAWALSLRA